MTTRNINLLFIHGDGLNKNGQPVSGNSVINGGNGVSSRVNPDAFKNFIHDNNGIGNTFINNQLLPNGKRVKVENGRTIVELDNTIVFVLPGAKFTAKDTDFKNVSSIGPRVSGIIVLGGTKRYSDTDYNQDKKLYTELQVKNFATGNPSGIALKNLVFLDASNNRLKEANDINAPKVQSALSNNNIVEGKFQAPSKDKLQLYFDTEETNDDKRIDIDNCSFYRLGNNELHVPALACVGLGEKNVCKKSNIHRDRLQ